MAEIKRAKARVIYSFPFQGANYSVGQVVSFSTDDLKILEKAGNVDSSKAAVEYAESAGAKVIEHVPVANVDQEAVVDGAE